MRTLADLFRRLKPRWPSGAGRKRAASLPLLILMSDARRLPEPERAVRALPRGSVVVFRHYAAADRRRRARRLVTAARRCGVRVLVAGDARLAAAVGADGVHLPEALARRGPGPWRNWRRKRWLVTAAAHGRPALFRAARAGADAALLGPVFATPSHPQRTPLGAVRFARLCRQSPIPVYALGGLSPRSIRRLRGTPLAGFAGIGAIAETAP